MWFHKDCVKDSVTLDDFVCPKCIAVLENVRFKYRFPELHRWGEYKGYEGSEEEDTEESEGEAEGEKDDTEDNAADDDTAKNQTADDAAADEEGTDNDEGEVLHEATEVEQSEDTGSEYEDEPDYGESDTESSDA